MAARLLDGAVELPDEATGEGLMAAAGLGLPDAVVAGVFVAADATGF